MFVSNLHLPHDTNRCPSQPTVNECTEGDYSYRRGELQWNISVLAADLKTATLDFDLPSSAAAEFFPISCAFSAAQNLAGLIVSRTHARLCVYTCCANIERRGCCCGCCGHHQLTNCVCLLFSPFP